MEVDLTEEGVPQQVIEHCVEVFGTVDVLVNCAGLYFSDDVLRFDRSKWDPMIQLNLTAAFEMSHEAAKVMILQKAAKLLISVHCFRFRRTAIPSECCSQTRISWFDQSLL